MQRSDPGAISAIVGMGGIGKTELALQYALTYKPNYPGGLCWLQARSGDVGSQLVRFGRSCLNLKPPDGMELVDQVKYCWLNWRVGAALVVFDDVTDYKLLQAYLPPATEPRFKVLMTTRLTLGSSVKQLQLGVLDKVPALALLEVLVGRTRIESQLNDAKQICEQLGFLPLGLELAGRYLAGKMDLSVADLLKQLKEKQLEARSLCKMNKDVDMTAELGVAAAFQLSWEALSANAQKLGCGLSLFAAAPIPWSLVEQCLVEQAPDELEEWRDDELLHLHLLQWAADSTYRLHPLIRDFLKNKQKNLVTADEQKDRYCTTMVEIAKKIPAAPTPREITTLAPVIPHIIEAATERYALQILNSLLNFATVSVNLAHNLEALACFEKILEFTTDSYPPWFGKGLALLGLNQYKEAIDCFNQALEITQDASEVWNGKGSALFGLEHYEEAVACFNKSLRIQPNDFYALDWRGHIQIKLGRYEEALVDFDEALILEPSYFAALGNRSMVLIQMDRHEEALLNCEKMLQADPNDFHSWDWKGYILNLLGRYEEALKCFEKSLEFRLYYQSFANKGNALLNLKRYEEAIHSYEKALEIKPDESSCFYNKACVYALLNKIEESVQNLQISIDLDPNTYLPAAKEDPNFDAIRQGEQFQNLFKET